MVSSKPLICLGIESTAHTFSVGIMDSQGIIRSIASDTYSPESGGLHPQKVVEHHYTCYKVVLLKAIHEAKIQFSDITLIAFSRGPGLGPCLRIGAALARTLASKLNIPIIGVNHCIAHVEIGRLLCHVEDPITLYVSGGNTIVTAFESGRYQVFGETLDLPIGNMLDMIARDLGIPHPGGPRIEQIAKKGKNYIPIPYIVKGMDLSFSGLYTFVANKIKSGLFTQEEKQNDLIFSLQETVFAMLSEVTERALAHTKKNNVLLTGGVAANKRLQEMLSYISQEHNTQFSVVPAKVAGDNGAMIAWAGILQFLSKGADTILETALIPKWRMDEIEVPWRTIKKIEILTLNPQFELKNNISTENKIPNEILTLNKKRPLNDNELLKELQITGQIIARGAEAVLIRSEWFSHDVIIKYRVPKLYRISEIDNHLRTQRTVLESRLMLDLGTLGIPVPPIYNVIPSKGYFIMKYIEGQRFKDIFSEMSESQRVKYLNQIGIVMANIHRADRIHGDLTTSNIILTPNGILFFIDFGLGIATSSAEDKAVDLHLFKRVLISSHGMEYQSSFKAFLDGYRTNPSVDCEKIIQKIDEIETRGRYIKKDQRKSNL